jgi:hypothetical protein
VQLCSVLVLHVLQCCEHGVTARLARQVACMGMHNMHSDTYVFTLHACTTGQE